MSQSEPARLEFTLYPAATQLNGKFTQHVGTFGAVTARIVDRVGLQVLGGGNWLNQESAFNGQLIETFRVRAQTASLALNSSRCASASMARR